MGIYIYFRKQQRKKPLVKLGIDASIVLKLILEKTVKVAPELANLSWVSSETF
jgi:hypothetical protein